MKLFQAFTATLAGLTLGSTTVVLLDRKHVIDLTDYPLGRATRTGLAVASIIVDYKYSLYGLCKDTKGYEKAKSQAHARSAKKLFDLCWQNRGTYIKVGQHLGAMDYLLPPEYTKVFKVFHSKAPQSTVAEIEQVLKEDLDIDAIDDVFTEFSLEPLGTASLAQVHKAKLKKDGSSVAVKVQHQNVRDLADKDMNMMDSGLNWVQYFFPEFDLMWLGEETRKNLPKELDFTIEAKNCQKAEKNLRCFDWVKLPKIYDEYTTPRVLVMEFLEGGQVNDQAYFVQHGIDFNKVASMLGKLYSEMIFVQGFVHCDPHPGNILIRWKKDKSSSWFSWNKKNNLELVLLDHGLYRQLSENFRYHYASLWQAIINRDMSGIQTHARALGSGNMYPLLATIVTGRAWTVVGEKGIKNVAMTNEEDNQIRDDAGTYLPHISQVLNSVPSEMLLVLKANDHLRGLEHMYGVRGHLSGFLDMSRCCLRALRELKVKRSFNVTGGVSCYLSAIRYSFVMYFGLFKITVYEWYLWVNSMRKDIYSAESNKTPSNQTVQTNEFKDKVFVLPSFK